MVISALPPLNVPPETPAPAVPIITIEVPCVMVPVYLNATVKPAILTLISKAQLPKPPPSNVAMSDIPAQVVFYLFWVIIPSQAGYLIIITVLFFLNTPKPYLVHIF